MPRPALALSIPRPPRALLVALYTLGCSACVDPSYQMDEAPSDARTDARVPRRRDAAPEQVEPDEPELEPDARVPPTPERDASAPRDRFDGSILGETDAAQGLDELLGLCAPGSTRHMFRLEGRVEWPATTTDFLGVPIDSTPGGIGFLRMIGLADFGFKDLRPHASVRACWGEVPDFAAYGQKFGARIPNESWDAIEERWGTFVYAACPRPDCQLSTDYLTGQLGLSVDVDAAWPARGSWIDPALMTDPDGDGTPGLYMVLRSPSEAGGYAYFPTPEGDRISALSVALRIGADLIGTVQTCEAFGGDGRRPTLSMTVLACWVDDGRRPCSQAQVDLVNSRLPDWQVTSARWQSNSLPQDADCSDVRTMLNL